MNEPENIYYDLQVKNLKNTVNESTQLAFTDARNSTILKKASDYEISVIRFQTDTTLLPVFIPTIEIGQSDPNLTIYTITLQSGSNIVQQPVVWTPEFLDAPVPAAPSVLPFQSQQENTNYYLSLNYQHFISLINVAFATAMTTLKALDGSITADAPFLGWAQDKLIAEMRADPVFDYESGSISIFMNRGLWALFTSLDARRQAITTSFGRIYKIAITSNNGFNDISSGKIVLKQNYSTISNWSPVSSIVFTSSTLPIYPANVSPPSVSLEGREYPVSNTGDFLNILTDISANEQSYKPNILYNPTAEYRFISLYSSGEITNVEIVVFWKSTSGNYYPLLVPSGGSASCKVLFRKKK